MPVQALLAAACFALFAYLAVRWSAVLSASIVPFADGPRPGRAPVAALVVGAGLIGAVLAVRSTGAAALALGLVICSFLVAAWYSDVRCGIVPDTFTLGPLAVVLAYSAVTHDWWSIESAAALTVPFAAAALVSHGRGMGWADVKLAALGGAALGLQTAIWAFMLACIVAIAVTLARRATRRPLAFVPYLAGSIGAFLPFAAR